MRLRLLQPFIFLLWRLLQLQGREPDMLEKVFLAVTIHEHTEVVRAAGDVDTKLLYTRCQPFRFVRGHAYGNGNSLSHISNSLSGPVKIVTSNGAWLPIRDFGESEDSSGALHPLIFTAGVLSRGTSVNLSRRLRCLAPLFAACRR